MKYVYDRENKRYFESLNSNGLIDVYKLFNSELAEGGQGYDDLQFFERDRSMPGDFDSDDERAKILFTEVEAGGALVYDVNSEDYEIFSAKEMEDGVNSVYVGVYDFVIIEEAEEGDDEW